MTSALKYSILFLYRSVYLPDGIRIYPVGIADLIKVCSGSNQHQLMQAARFSVFDA